jgi:DUF4097 and DUF4098 domain-containing protein YvlB
VHCEITLAAFSGTTASGALQLQDVASDATVKAASGDVRAGVIGGRLRVQTASGDVSIRRVDGNADLSLASGDVRIGEAQASVEVKSASGDVAIGCARSGLVKVQTASGDVVIGLAPGVGAYLDVTRVSGETRSSLPFTEASTSGSALEVVCRTVSGDVTIRGAAS